MTGQPEAVDMALSVALALPPADMARFADVLEIHLGDPAPIPEFLGLAEELESFYALQSMERMKIIVREAFREMKKRDIEKARALFAEVQADLKRENGNGS